MNYLFIQSSEIAAPGTAVFSPQRSREALEDHALSSGLEIAVAVEEAGLGKGRCTIDSAGLLTVQFSVTRPPPERLPLDFLIGIARPQTLKKVLVFAATVGARTVTFVGAERAPKSYLQSAVLRPPSVRRLFQLGLEQGGDCRSPALTIEKNISQALANLAPHGTRVMLDNRGEEAAIDFHALNAPFLIAVGPEAGWSEDERGGLIRGGCRPFSLGPRTLRVEQALMVGAGFFLPRLIN